MFGDNPKRPPVDGDGKILSVKNIFKTIQGEGPLVGTPAIFIRLGGCNLACKFCDTDFEDFASFSIDKIMNTVQNLNSSSLGLVTKLVVITGGEPLRQPIELLCQRLLDTGYRVQIETNGTLYRPLPPEVYIVCSPKAKMHNSPTYYAPIREDLLPSISAIKFLVAQNLPAYRDIPEIGQNKYNIPVFVQPMDQNDAKLNQANIQLALNLSLQKGYRFSLQMHKILDIA